MSRDPEGPSIDQTITALVSDLAPVAAVRLWRGMAAVVLLTGLAIGGIWLGLGLRADVLAGRPAPIVAARGAILLAGGLAMLLAALRAAVPGREDRGAALTGTLLLGLLPIGLMGLLLDGIMARQHPSFAEIGAYSALRCLAVAFGASLVVGAGLVLWMRRAAPTDLPRAGWLTGWAAAALGTFAYSLFCPSMTLAFTTTVYPAAMLLAATFLRVAVPPLLRW